jgi:hypothetical protein
MEPSSLLVRHGWDDGWASLVADDEVAARIVRVDRGECDVAT